MSQRRESKKLKVQPPPPEDMEEDWDSQAEEAEEDSLEDSLEEDSLEEENEEAEEVEEVTAGKQLSPAAETSNSAIISAPSRGTRRRPSSRWDETGRFPNPTTASKTAPTIASKSRQSRQKKTAAATSNRKPAAAVKKYTTSAATGGLKITANEPAQTRELRNRIFPTLYAIFQQSRGQEQELKIKNRSLRSLTRSCLYHKSEDQLQRTLEDAEALFNKYCALTLKE
ncbi:33 kDa protein [Human adenovirus 55]|uniref:L4 n=2 Tax=Human mastadenovirus B TaxID=108098 RepID=K4NUG0_9ADEN|nr:splicing factor [Human mastadenovirus B]AFV48155.1 33 kDa protein [Human adenovirus 55]AKR05301.1 L4 25.4 kDa protein [Human adenovirus 55]APH07238.1 33 kDa protein [Human adenovirus 55]AQY04112.1 L4 [Human adenovirus 55]